jgi:secreted trypsin-like serine protease
MGIICAPRVEEIGDHMRLLLRLVAFAPATLMLAFLQSDAASALVGASVEAGPLESSQVVLVTTIKGRSSGFCTGVVISPTIILTAGHCVHRANAIAVNAAAVGTTPQLIEASAHVLHPEFRDNAAARRERSIDLALLRLNEALPAHFSQARLSSRAVTQAGELFQILGFGLTQEGVERSAGRLRAGALQAREPLSRILLWARDPQEMGFGACTGDSGGPIFDADGQVFAITSWSTGAGNKSCGALTQAALIAPQRAWITKTIASWR